MYEHLKKAQENFLFPFFYGIGGNPLKQWSRSSRYHIESNKNNHVYNEIWAWKFSKDLRKMEIIPNAPTVVFTAKSRKWGFSFKAPTWSWGTKESDKSKSKLAFHFTCFSAAIYASIVPLVFLPSHCFVCLFIIKRFSNTARSFGFTIFSKINFLYIILQ